MVAKIKIAKHMTSSVHRMCPPKSIFGTGTVLGPSEHSCMHAGNRNKNGHAIIIIIVIHCVLQN